MKTIRLVLLPLLIVGTQCFAHEDHAVQVAADGSLSGLPATYSPAKLKVGFSNVDGERGVSALSLQLADKHVELPTCVLGLLDTQRPEDMQLSASWDHDESVVPYYLEVKLFDADSQPQDWGRAGFSLLFNLHNAKLMQVEVDVAHPREQRIESIPVDLRARCSDDELKSILSADR